MKKIFLLLLLLCSLVGGAMAQTWRTPTQVGNSNYVNKNLSETFFISATQGWAVGDGGTILTTTDGGITWTAQTSGTTNFLYSVYFTSATQGWAVGFGGTILTTTNGGTTWTPQTSGTTNLLNSVYFISATQGWAVGDGGRILTTTNGGTSWTAQTSSTTNFLSSVYFKSATQGWAVGSRGTILTTTNGGTTWTAQTSGATNNLLSVYFTTATQGWAVGFGGRILTTTNGGTSWTVQTSSTTNNLLSVYFTTTTQGWAVGIGGIILTTTNGGTTWTAQTSGTTNPLSSVNFTSATQGWAVGTGGTILTTTNGGTTWTAQTSGTTSNLRSVFFISATQGWAVGASGTILTTTNGGTTWITQASGTINALNSVYFTSATQGWAVGENGTILTTTNGGTTWTAQTSGITNPLSSVYFTSATQGWAAVGSGSTILTTTNGGTTWTAQTSGTTNFLISIYFTTATQGWAVGGAGTILTTINGGTTWTAQTSNTTNFLFFVYFTSATQGWAVGDGGTILTTTDGGITWTAQTSGTTNLLYSVYFTSATQGWAVGDAGTILTTTNGGTTWTAQTSGITNSLFSVYFTSATQGWAVGSGGTILLYGARPSITTTGTPTPFTACAGTASATQTFTVSGNDLTSNIVVTAPTGYEVSTASGSGFASSVILPQSGGTVSNTTVYARLTSSAMGSASGNIALTSTDAITQNVSVSGTVNALPSISLGSVSNITTTATTFSLPYTATTGSPNQYSITAGTPNAMAGFSAVSNASLTGSPLSVTIPASAANTYNFVATVSNSTTGCVSANNNFTVTVAVPTTPFKTTWKVAGGNIIIPTNSTSGSYNYTVNYRKQGTTTYTTLSNQTGNCTILGLANDDIIEVEITGVFPHFYMDNDPAQRTELLSIEAWGNQNWKSMKNSFYGCYDLVYNATDNPDLSSVTDMGSMFQGCRKFNGNITGWNTSNVTNMSVMFYDNRVFNQNIGLWNTSKVTDMSYMFSDATAFNQDLTGLELNAVTNMTEMLDRSGLSIANYDATLTGWLSQNKTGLTLGATRLIYCNATAARTTLTTPTTNGGKGWTIIGDKGCTTTTLTSSQNPASSGSSVTFTASVSPNTATGTVTFKDGITTLGTGTLSAGQATFATTTLPTGTRSITAVYEGNTTNATSTSTVLSQVVNAVDPTTLFITRWDLSKSFFGAVGANEFSFGVATTGPVNYTWQEVGGSNLSGSGTFTGIGANITGLPANAIIDLSIDPTNFQRINMNNGAHSMRLTEVKQWGTVAWTSMETAFNGCNNFTLTATDVPNFAGVTNMSQMFSGCSSFNQALPEGIITTGVTNMSAMFKGCKTYNQSLPSSFNTAAVTDMSFMFFDCNAYNKAFPSNFNTANVVNMESMFWQCTAYNQPLSNSFVTGAVTNMNEMFFRCKAYNQTLPNSFTTAAVVRMESMFNGATSFNQPIANWNTTNVTNMREMFSEATSFNEPIGNWNTTNVTNMREMFNGATSFNQPVGNWNTANVTSMVSMFYGAASFDQDLSGLELGSVTELDQMLSDLIEKGSPVQANIGMSSANYDATLIGWATQNVQPGVTLGANGRKYCASAAARTTLTTTKGWTITGDASACTTTTLTSNLNPSSSGSNVMFTANVLPTTATGTVTFKDGTTTLGTGTLSAGVATFATTALEEGTRSITAVYEGNTTNATSTSAVLGQVVLNCTLTTSPGNVDITWTGFQNKDWNNACNWNPAWVPDVTNAKAIIPGSQEDQPIISGTVPDVNSIDINGGTLTINSGATLNIRENGGVNKGIKIDGGTLTNNGNINIESSTNTAINAYIYLSSYTSSSNSTFNNNGTVKINSTDEAIGVGLTQTSDAFITNNGTINVVNGIGIEVALASDVMTFVNNGIINYNGSALALSLQGNTSFTNNGILNINSGTGISKTSSVSLINNLCGRILMASGAYVNGGGTTLNKGLFQMPMTYDYTNTGTFTNNGIVRANTVSGITNNNVIISNTCPIFTIGGSSDYAVNGVFTNAAATNSAGTYTSVGNLFLANNTLPNGSQTLYAKLTGGECDHVVVVPFDFNNIKPTAVSISSTTVCEGLSVNLLANCASGTPTWYAAATGGTALGVGSSYSYSPPNGTDQSFYVSCETASCKSSRTVTSNYVTVKSLPAKPTISGNNEICEGEVASLSANSLFTFSNTNPVYQWSNGTGGFNIQVSPSVTSTYSVTVTVDGCTSESSAVFTVIVNPKPAIPTITADNMIICKGGTVVLSGSCAATTDIFRWETPPFSNQNSSTLGSTNQRVVTEPGIYKGLCESNKGCLSEKRSITITPAEDCNPANFITISPEKPAICPNTSISLTAKGCTGSVIWSELNQTGNSIVVSPSTSTVYFATCSTGGSATVNVVVAVPSIEVTNNISTGKEIYKATNSIQSAKKIGNPNFTPAPNVIYEAGRSITLSPGFVAEKWSVFKAEIKTCNN